MKNKRIVKILLIVSPILIGLLSSVLVKDMSLRYEDIRQPLLSPPAIVFPIVWTILYILMGVAAALIYTSDTNIENRNMGLVFHIIQIVLNFFWSLIFFNLKLYLFSFIWLVLLWLVVFSMILNYRKVSTTAYLLNIPYLVWLTFAGYLNFMIFLIN